MRNLQRPTLRSTLGVFIALGLSVLMLAMFNLGLPHVLGAEAAPPFTEPLFPAHTNEAIADNYQTDVPVCEQAKNLVENPGFEQGIGWENGWLTEGSCVVQVSDSGYEGENAAVMIAADNNRECVLRTISYEIDVEPSRVYHYIARVKADLLLGETFLRVQFWTGTGTPIGIVNTRPVSDTEGEWITLTGAAPNDPESFKDARYARVEAVVSAESAGTVHFDSMYLGLATCLGIEKHDISDPKTRGSFLTYTVAYSNHGLEKATNVEIKEVYDSHVSFVEAQPAPEPGYDDTWRIAELAPGISDTLTVVVELNDTVLLPGWIFNTVSIRSSETLSNPVYDTISSQMVITDSTCGLELDVHTPQKIGVQGYPTDYSLTLKNTGVTSGQVMVTASSLRDWDVDISPTPPYSLSGGDDREIMVSPQVPLLALGGTTDITLITATLTCDDVFNSTITRTTSVTTIAQLNAIQGVTLTGNMEGLVNTTYTFTATSGPPETTFPIIYQWQADEQQEWLTTTRTLNHSIPYHWETPGTKNITVTATNDGSPVSDTFTITITAVKPYNVAITNSAMCLINSPCVLSATVSPPTVTHPVAYNWSPTPSLGGQGEGVVTYTWSTGGSKLITVTATNIAGMITNTHTVFVEEYYCVYLPLVLRFPNPPKLLDIENADQDGSYTVNWIPPGEEPEITYVLEEARNSGFSAASMIYTITETTNRDFSNKLMGTYYYRVRALHSLWSTDFSNIKSVAVQQEPAPNNWCDQALGPILPGVEYYGYHDDSWDFYSIDVDTGGVLSVDLFTDQPDIQLQLRAGDGCTRLPPYAYQPPYHIDYTAAPGRYYIAIFTANNFGNTRYTLKAEYQPN